MAKKITAVVKLQLPAGKATPGPPVGSSLGPHGINIPAFTKEFNEKTAKQAGLPRHHKRLKSENDEAGVTPHPLRQHHQPDPSRHFQPQDPPAPHPHKKGGRHRGRAPPPQP